MIRNWFTRYNPKYVRALVYMLQASEYNIGDYLRWYHRVGGFRHIEKRKQLVKTPKALFIFAAAWLMLIGLYAGAVSLVLSQGSFLHYVVAVVILMLAPYILGYLLLVPVVIVKLLQWPTERLIIRRASFGLQKHKGVKISIAGSYGKTSMREMLKTILSEGKKVAAAPHSYNTPLGIARFIGGLSGDEDILIFEFGEYYPGDIAKLARMVKPDMGIITGVNEAHLQKFKTLKQTVGTVFELSDWLGKKPVYVNGESPLALARAKKEHIMYSRAGVGSWKVKDAETNLDGTRFVLYDSSQEVALNSQLLGLHQVGPLAAASHLALQLGLTLSQVQEGVSKTMPFDHRLQPKNDNGVILIDDSYNGNPDGVQAIITFLASLNGYRRWYVTPGLVEMGSQTEEIHKNIGWSLAKANIEKVVLIKNSVTGFIEEGLKQANYEGEIIWFDDALKAYAAMPQMTVAGDVVVLQNDWADQYA